MSDPATEPRQDRRTNYRQLFSFAVCCAIICWIIEYPIQPAFAAVNQNTLLVGDQALIDSQCTVTVTDLIPLGGKTVEELLRLRVKAVWQQPLLIGINYRPADAVFCRLRSRADWLDSAGSEDSTGSGGSPSAGSEYLLNPYLLIAADVESVAKAEDDDFAPFPGTLRPASLVWDPAHSQAVAAYDVSQFVHAASRYAGERLSLRDISLRLVGLNARDMNLNYAAALPEDVWGMSVPAGLHRPVLIDQYLRYEPDCGKAGGCNELSPSAGEFTGLQLTNLPARITMRLWKDLPESMTETPDMWFVLEFR